MTIETIKLFNRLGLKSIIGLSNLSFGWPEREKINAAFLCLGIQAGLKGAILNASEPTTMKVLSGALTLERIEKKKFEPMSPNSLINFLLKGKKADIVLKECLKIRPDLLGLSAMITTTVGRIKEIADQLRANGLDLPILAGGASMNRLLAEKFRVHYAQEAIFLPWVKGRPPELC